jgi:hypothetical protein
MVEVADKGRDIPCLFQVYGIRNPGYKTVKTGHGRKYIGSPVFSIMQYEISTLWSADVRVCRNAGTFPVPAMSPLSGSSVYSD